MGKQRDTRTEISNKNADSMHSGASRSYQHPRNTCCACGREKRVRNIVMLDQKALTPGAGWGCVVCNLPNDGAVAVICDECAANGTPLQFAVDGYLESGALVAIGELPDIPHAHDLKLHSGDA